MKIRPRSRYVLFFATIAFIALLLLRSESVCRAQAPAAEPAAEAPSEPQVPIMLRQFREIREFKGPDGEMIPIEENRRLRQIVGPLLTSGKFSSAEDQKAFDEFYRWRIAEMTWAENLSKLSDKRSKIKRLDLGVSGRPTDTTVHDKLNSTLLNVLQNIAKSDDFHPAVRTNCVLLIGDLDQKEEADAGRTPPVPMPEALPVLAGMANDPKLPDCVRIPALLGVARHAEHEVPAAARKDAIVPLLVAIVGAKQPMGVGDIGGHGWLRRRGAESLGVVASKWPEANTPLVAGALFALIGDEEASLISRTEAAKSVGAIERGALTNNAGAIAQAIGSAAVAVAKHGPVADTGKLGTDYLTYLYLGFLSGLKGGSSNHGLLAAAGDADTRLFINDLIKKIDEMLSVATDRNLPEETRIERLNTLGDRLEEWLKKAGLKLARGG